MAALDFPASPTLNEVYSANGRSWIWNGTTWNPYGSGIADGDRGDITVSSNGSVWTVDGGAITYAKIQDVSAASKLLGRGDSGSGDVQEITLGSGLSMTGTTLAATVTDTGITQLTGDVTAGPGSGSQAATIANDAVTFAKMQNISGTTLIGRHDGGSGSPQEVSVGNGLEFSGSGVRRSALTGDVTASAGSNTTAIANGAVTYAKMQDVSAASKLIGRGSASGSGDPEEITLGSGLTMTGTTLSASGGGATLTYAQLGSGVAITDNATFQDITGLSFSASANTSYRIRFHMAVSTTATSTGYEVGINGPASPTGYFAIVSLWNSATAETATITNSTTYGSIGANANAGGGTARPCEGIILFHNGANAGTVILQGKVETSVVGTVTFETGSFMTWEQVTT